MTVYDFMEFMNKYAKCPECGCEVVGNGKGTFECDTFKGYFKRTCHCGWFIEVTEEDLKTKS